MVWDKGFSFRFTSGFVTDGVDETYVLSADNYPVTRNGVTFGWNIAPIFGEDNDAGIDRRLAGVNYQENTGFPAEFQVDLLHSGDCTIRLALGSLFPQDYQYLQVKDGAIPVLTIDNASGTGISEWHDAVGTIHSDVVWPGSNAPVDTIFGGPTLTLLLGSPTSQMGNSTLAHFFVSQSEEQPARDRGRRLATQQLIEPGEVAPPTRNRRLATQQRMAG